MAKASNLISGWTEGFPAHAEGGAQWAGPIQRSKGNGLPDIVIKKSLDGFATAFCFGLGKRD